MKSIHIIATLLLCFGALLPASAQKVGVPSTHCEIGLMYQISYQPNWGDSRAVVVEVAEGGPASMAGLKMGDIIESINGKPTKDLSEEEINAMLLDPTQGSVQLGVSNFGYTAKPLAIKKKCRPAQALSEETLARAFSMYSLEDVTERRFTLPFVYSVPDKVDYRRYKTFSFVAGKRLSAVDQALQKELQKKGLTYVTTGGDLTVRVQTQMGANPNYRKGAESDQELGFKNYRVNTQTGEIERYPFLSINAPSFTGTHLLRMEVQLWDRASNTLIWSVKARELLNGNYSVEKYAKDFTPFLLSNFPFVRYLMNPSFVLHKNNYRYLGIYYDATDLQRVLWVDKNSPADKAGIRSGDRIVSINGLPLDPSSEKMTEAYIDLIKQTQKHRDEESRFPSNDGFQHNKYWRLDRYPQVMKAMQNTKNLAAFSYLFSHRSYVHSPIIKEIALEVDRGNGVEIILITPQLLHRDYITLY